MHGSAQTAGAELLVSRCNLGEPCIIGELKAGDLTRDETEQIDRIFLEASGRIFASQAELADFRERWLGRYLHGGTDVLLVARDCRQSIAGYLVGALDDPAEQTRFADLPYFRGEFRDFCQAYPAHLHINLAPAARRKGLGGRLIEAFAVRARTAGAAGMHVVTGREARNVSFYTRCGFTLLGAAPRNGGEVVFLGRRLHFPA